MTPRDDANATDTSCSWLALCVLLVVVVAVVAALVTR